jgi:hypothetical protein
MCMESYLNFWARGLRFTFTRFISQQRVFVIASFAIAE